MPPASLTCFIHSCRPFICLTDARLRLPVCEAVNPMVRVFGSFVGTEVGASVGTAVACGSSAVGCGGGEVGAVVGAAVVAAGPQAASTSATMAKRLVKVSSLRDMVDLLQ